ncbi:hypothetical protein [Rhizobium cremeum]|uniref:hypothetical protein n=1 Tax=Rhizobium cremeum TaxID=2813827 RepID=UPI000DE52C88
MFINREAALANDADAILKGVPLRALLAVSQPFEAGLAISGIDAVILIENDHNAFTPSPEGMTCRRFAYLQNEPEHDRLATRLARLMDGKPCGIVLGGTRDGPDLQRLDALLAVEEAKRQIAIGETLILAVIGDNPAGLLHAASFAGRTLRLRGLGWNSRVLRQNGETGGASHLAGELTLLAAANAGVPAFGWLDSELSGDALAETCTHAHRAGFAALVASRPDQISAILATRDRDADSSEKAR